MKTGQGWPKKEHCAMDYRAKKARAEKLAAKAATDPSYEFVTKIAKKFCEESDTQLGETFLVTKARGNWQVDFYVECNGIMWSARLVIGQD